MRTAWRPPEPMTTSLEICTKISAGGLIEDGVGGRLGHTGGGGSRGLPRANVDDGRTDGDRPSTGADRVRLWSSPDHATIAATSDVAWAGSLAEPTCHRSGADRRSVIRQGGGRAGRSRTFMLWAARRVAPAGGALLSPTSMPVLNPAASTALASPGHNTAYRSYQFAIQSQAYRSSPRLSWQRAFRWYPGRVAGLHRPNERREAALS